MNILEEFSKKFELERLLIFETKYWNWSLRPHQPVLGASILSLKRKCLNFSDLTQDEFNDLKEIATVIEKTLKKTFEYDVINYLMLMMVDKHVHFHVFPRYENARELNNRLWKDELWPAVPALSGEELSQETANEIIEVIRKEII